MTAGWAPQGLLPEPPQSIVGPSLGRGWAMPPWTLPIGVLRRSQDIGVGDSWALGAWSEFAPGGLQHPVPTSTSCPASCPHLCRLACSILPEAPGFELLWDGHSCSYSQVQMGCPVAPCWSVVRSGGQSSPADPRVAVIQASTRRIVSQWLAGWLWVETPQTLCLGQPGPPGLCPPPEPAP